MARKKRVLFVCVGNSCRSQMAEGFAKRYGRDIIEVKSAGTAASGVVNRSTTEAMREVGIDISTHTSDQLTKDMLLWADVVVTMGCNSLDYFWDEEVSARRIDWQIEDPLGKPWDVMVRVREDIEKKVRELIKRIKEDKL